MADRVQGFTVVLDKPMHAEDAEVLLTAFRAFRNVISVNPVIAQGSDEIAVMRVRSKLNQELQDVSLKLLSGGTS